MKKLLSVLGILVLASALLPMHSHASYRGSFDPITAYGSGLVNGHEQAAFRPGSPTTTTGWRTSLTAGKTERFFAMTTRSQVVGSETVREMWLFDNTSQAVLALAEFKWPLLVDPAAMISYTDPAWSPDGNWLAYVKTDNSVTFAEIWVQQFVRSSTGSVAVTPVGAPILVVPAAPGTVNRHPDWSPDGTTLAFDSNMSGLSIDLYTVPVFPAVGAPVRVTFNDGKAEINPVWSPDGTKLVFSSNLYGPFILKVLTLATVPNPTDGDLAETNFAPVTHSVPRWSHVPGENVLYYDASDKEDPNQPPQIWRLDMATQSKCEINFDARGSYGVDVSKWTNTDAATGLKFNYILFSSTAAGLGLNIWRASYVYSCVPPLPMDVIVQPSTWNIKAGDAVQSVGNLYALMYLPPESKAAGFRAQSTNSGAVQGMKMRTSLIPSPTMLGLADDLYHPDLGAPYPDYADTMLFNDTELAVRTNWSSRRIVTRLTALGLIGRQTPIQMGAYSNQTGRRFVGYFYVKVTPSSLKSGSLVSLMQNSPNPFNPTTKITFANSKAGVVELRIFNARGELVQTLAKQWFPQGEHTVSWDGRTTSGGSAPSGMYFAQVRSNEAVDSMKMMMMK